MRRPVLTVLLGGRHTVRDDTRALFDVTRRRLKALIKRALADGDLATAEALMRCRDALARAECELVADELSGGRE